MRMQAVILLFILFISLYVKSKGLVRAVEKCGEEWGWRIPRDILLACLACYYLLHKIVNSNNHSHIKFLAHVLRVWSRTYNTALVHRQTPPKKCRYGLIGSTLSWNNHKNAKHNHAPRSRWQNQRQTRSTLHHGHSRLWRHIRMHGSEIRTVLCLSRWTSTQLLKVRSVQWLFLSKKMHLLVLKKRCICFVKQTCVFLRKGLAIL